MIEDWLKSRKVNTASSMGRATSAASVIGLHMVIATFLGLGIGYFLDDFFDTAPWLTIIFLFLGILAGFKNFITQAQRLMDCQEKEDKEQRAEELALKLKSMTDSLDSDSDSNIKKDL